ncbi:MAG: cofactor-independent phosphoglycerate mutase [Deltaproteobacteria bacterium]|jgi:2,3-bisphosphoglycerate-independent phosphoglycerate mutase|nr:cofactor-independent phosphoglycerate mutase [Deltaproteobacteria bacterium]
MKYLIVIGDGMGDYPVDSLGGRTPLDYAPTPRLDALAKRSLVGRVATIPEGMAPGSDVAIMSLMGYNPKGVLTGRGPLEALALGVPLKESDVAFRMNLVTMEWGTHTIIRNHSAGDVTGEEAAELLDSLRERMPLGDKSVHQGVSYRNLLLWPGAPEPLPSIPPHDYRDKPVDFLLDDPANAPLVELLRASWPILINHPVNQKRLSKGLPPANSIWLWGQGRAPKVKSYAERWGLTGATVSAVDIIRGLGLATGLKPLRIEGATGWLDTNYAGKAAAAVESLKTGDLCVVHLEAPDETSHQGRLDQKLEAIERFDRQIVGPIVDALEAEKTDFRLLAACDHYTPLALKTHTADPVPFLLYDSRQSLDGPERWHEAAAMPGPLVPDGPALARLLFGPEKGA